MLSPSPSEADLVRADRTTVARERLLLAHAREGLEARHVAARLARGETELVLFVARDHARAAQLEALLAFWSPQLELLRFPAWDCLPYDRASPSSEIMGERLRTLARLARPAGQRRRVVLTTANAILQRVPPRETVVSGHMRLTSGKRADRERLLDHLERHGYRRAGTVVEPGEYAVRGGLVDLFPVGAEHPARLDFFGTTLESIRSFDPLSQRSLDRQEVIELTPVSELALDTAGVERFRIGYLQRFGAVAADPLLEAVSAGRAFPGMEHWLPLFHEHLVTLFDHLPPTCEVALDHLALAGIDARAAQIGEHHEARTGVQTPASSFGAAVYRPLPPDMLYLDEQGIRRILEQHRVTEFTIFAAPPVRPAGVTRMLDLGGRPARDFARERADRSINLFDAIVAHLRELVAAGTKPIIAVSTQGAADRLVQVLDDHGLDIGITRAASWREARSAGAIVLAVLPLEHGVVTDSLHLLAEQDLLGDRLVRARKPRRSDRFIADLGRLGEGDLVVHAAHGIARFEGLETLEIGGAPHDCLKLLYAGGDRLFVPVENLEILSRYGQGEGEAQLDKLGGVGWQQRRSKVKERIRELAGELIKIAAARQLRQGEAMVLPPGIYDEFAARFPFEETEDQLKAIEVVLEDMGSGRPMDRLLCGDVGFGKTEVALRAAFVAAMSGKQVALLCPTTLLARQHHGVFAHRFDGLPIKVAQLSRFVTAKDAELVKKGLTAGDIDIVVGTHALLGKGVAFRDLGLVIVDEEQHFGVAHKERLKQLRAEVHVLTMTATPIPRTLQMALGGMRDLSIIATPPIDRLAVRTFVMPADPVVLREAILREHHRGGQTFFVCPRVADQVKLQADLGQLVPEIRIAVANGKMPAAELDAVMGGFYDGTIDLLLATNIVESGLDIPRANTLIVHRADLFGLSQLYQLRGRVGRSKVRGYAYFTVPAQRTLADTAEKRLHIIQSLEGLGAGFQLASHDLDIRGAGNLLGDEQSGQIKEVGFELYNHMLDEAVAELRRSTKEAAAADGDAREWTPQITVDAAALMPESYIGDLDLRLAMYRRLASLEAIEELDGFAAELVDRFGAMPTETSQLLEIVAVKQLCRRANVAKLDAGPKGIVITFRDNRFAHPDRLVRWIGESKGRARVRPDHRLLVQLETASPAERLKAARRLSGELAALAG